MQNKTVLYLAGIGFLISQIIFLFGANSLPQNVFGIVIVVNVLSLTIAAFAHGFERYGMRNTIIFFAITAVVSWSLETSSIANGFPFGHYVYADRLGLKLGTVPLLILPSYFSMGYFSWTMAHALVQHFQRIMVGSAVVAVPLIGSFLMVMWDLSIDPVASTISKNWIWTDGGAYFGVPYSNFLGWFLTVYIIFQVFALFIARVNTTILNLPDSRFSWNFAVAMYFIKAITSVLQPLFTVNHLEIYQSMSLVALFSMTFVAVLTFLNIEAKYKTMLEKTAPISNQISRAQ